MGKDIKVVEKIRITSGLLQPDKLIIFSLINLPLQVVAWNNDETALILHKLSLKSGGL